MQKSKLAVNWIENKLPTQPGTYFTAQRYTTGFGVYDVAVWDGEQWLLDNTIRVVGWVAFDNVLQSLDINWPTLDNKDNTDFSHRHEATKEGFKPDGFVELD